MTNTHDNLAATGSPTPTRAPNAPQPRDLLKVTLARLFGTMLEFYDHFIYGTAAALIFPKVFFAGLPSDVALILSLIIYGIAFVSRPLGAMIFGHYGDKLGRKTILVLVLMIMGLATFAIGLLPSYDTAGMTGAILLVVLRLLQGIALGGEWGGAALMVSEYTKGLKIQGLLGSVVQIASPLGFLLASGTFALVTHFSTEATLLTLTWRFPFLLSAVLVIIGLYIRRSIDESPEFEANKAQMEANHQPLKLVFTRYRKNLALAIGSRIGSYVAFYVFALFPLVYLPFIGIDKSVALNATIIAALGQASGIPLFGWLSDKWSTRGVLLLGAVLNALVTIVFFMLLNTHSEALIYLAAFMGLFALAALWAPLAAHFPKMFPVAVRFTGAGVGFQAAGILGGAIAPTICVALMKSMGSPWGVAGYLIALLVLLFACVWMTRTEEG